MKTEPLSEENRKLAIENVTSVNISSDTWVFDAPNLNRLLDAARASSLPAVEALTRIADDWIDEPATWGGAAEWMRRIAREALGRPQLPVPQPYAKPAVEVKGWTWDRAGLRHDDWHPTIGFNRPNEGTRVRNVQPLYAAPPHARGAMTDLYDKNDAYLDPTPHARGGTPCGVRELREALDHAHSIVMAAAFRMERLGQPEAAQALDREAADLLALLSAPPAPGGLSACSAELARHIFKAVEPVFAQDRCEPSETDYLKALASFDVSACGLSAGSDQNDRGEGEK